MDARIVHSQGCIKHAFIELIHEKPVPKITVVDICKRANVNRATFYKYFESPVDLLGKIEEDLLEELSKKLEKGPADTPEEFIKIVLNELDIHDDVYSLVFLGEGDFAFRKKFIDTIRVHSINYLRQFFTDIEDYKLNWIYNFTIMGSVGACQMWRAGDTVEGKTFDDVRTFIHAFANYLCEMGRNFNF